MAMDLFVLLSIVFIVSFVCILGYRLMKRLGSRKDREVT